MEPAELRPTKAKLLQCLQVLADYPEGLTATEWQETSGLSETTFYRYRKELQNDLLVEKDGNRYRLTGPGKAALTPTPNALPDAMEAGGPNQLPPLTTP